MEFKFRAVDVRPSAYCSDSTVTSSLKRPQGKGNPDPINHCGEKRKPDEEWSCALCQVSATSEQGLIQHIQGKKHRRKEEKLRPNQPLKKNPKTDDLVEKNLNKESSLEFKEKKKFKLWCEMCRIGAYSEVVMEAHENGKKHLARLQQLGRNTEAVSSMTAMESSSEACEKARNAKAKAENANGKLLANTLNVEKSTNTTEDNEAKIEEATRNGDAENVTTDVRGSI